MRSFIATQSNEKEGKLMFSGDRGLMPIKRKDRVGIWKVSDGRKEFQGFIL